MKDIIILELNEYLQKLKKIAEEDKIETKKEVLSHQDGLSHNYETEDEDYREAKEGMAKKHNIDISNVYINVDGDYIIICANTKRKKTNLEKEEEIIKNFNKNALSLIIKKLMKTSNYERIPYDHNKFINFNPYNLFINEEYDDLIKYYEYVLIRKDQNETNI